MKSLISGRPWTPKRSPVIRRADLSRYWFLRSWNSLGNKRNTSMASTQRWTYHRLGHRLVIPPRTCWLAKVSSVWPEGRRRGPWNQWIRSRRRRRWEDWFYGEWPSKTVVDSEWEGKSFEGDVLVKTKRVKMQ